MRILFDQGTPAPLRRYLTGHSTVTAAEAGWASLKNGELLSAADDAGFDLLITTDQSLRYQQKLSDRKVAILVILTTRWPRAKRHVQLIVDAVASMTLGSYAEVAIP